MAMIVSGLTGARGWELIRGGAGASTEPEPSRLGLAAITAYVQRLLQRGKGVL